MLKSPLGCALGYTSNNWQAVKQYPADVIRRAVTSTT
jgi:hypothetical protein